MSFEDNPTTIASHKDEHLRRNLFQEAGLEPRASEPLPLEACRAKISCAIPPVWQAETATKLECSIQNTGSGTYLMTLPNPVALACKWRGTEPHNRELCIEGNRTPLPRPLLPGQSVSCQASLSAPAVPGRYKLTVTLVQEQCAWFDDLDPANAVCAEVQVTS